MNKTYLILYMYYTIIFLENQIELSTIAVIGSEKSAAGMAYFGALINGKYLQNIHIYWAHKLTSAHSESNKKLGGEIAEIGRADRAAPVSRFFHI